jgi:hypothetical protein
VTKLPQRKSLMTRENILFALGLAIIIFEVVSAEVLDRPFHYEFLVLGGSLVGVGITQLGDRGSK